MAGDATRADQRPVAVEEVQAAQRAEKEPATPDWEKAYLAENFKQWRFFVRSARKDETWGPKLEGE